MTERGKTLRTPALLAAAFAVALSCTGTASAADISANASVGPMPGSCPGTITFTATITADNWSPTARREVQYTWVRDDGGNSPSRNIYFPEGSSPTRTVSTTWTLGASHAGWQAIHITYPQDLTSNHANFRFSCGGGDVAPSPEDCISYNPGNVAIVDRGSYWQLVDGSMMMQIFATQSDALAGLALARAHSQQCFIGRSNPKPDRYRYITEYWK
jgi:hypothetical protein